MWTGTRGTVLVVVLLFSTFLAVSAGTKRVGNGSRGRGLGRYEADYDDLIENPLPIVSDASAGTKKVKEAIADTTDGKDTSIGARTCPTSNAITIPSNIFDISTWFGTGTGVTGITDGVAIAAIIIALIKIKIVVIAFIIWIWWAGWLGGSKGGGGGGGGGDGGYGYSSDSYGPPQMGYGAPVQPSYGAPTQASYGAPSASYSSRGLNLSGLGDYVWKAIDAFAEKYELKPDELLTQKSR